LGERIRLALRTASLVALPRMGAHYFRTQQARDIVRKALVFHGRYEILGEIVALRVVAIKRNLDNSDVPGVTKFQLLEQGFGVGEGIGRD